MISITVRLHSAINADRDRVLAVALLSNDGTGNERVGNYKYAIAHQHRGPEAMAEFLETGGERQCWKRGRVTGYNRARSVWLLVGKTLRAAGL